MFLPAKRDEASAAAFGTDTQCRILCSRLKRHGHMACLMLTRPSSRTVTERTRAQSLIGMLRSILSRLKSGACI